MSDIDEDAVLLTVENIPTLNLLGKLIFIAGTDSPVTVTKINAYPNPDVRLAQYQLYLGRKNPDANDKSDPELGVSIWITAFNALPVYYVGTLNEGDTYEIPDVVSIACTEGNILTAIGRSTFISAKSMYQSLLNSGGADKFILYDIIHKRTYYLAKESFTIDTIGQDGRYVKVPSSRYVLLAARGLIKCVASAGLDFSRYMVLPVENITTKRTVYYKGGIFEVKDLFSPSEFWGYRGGQRSDVFIPLEVVIGQPSWQ